MMSRLGMATVLAGILGVDRDLHHKPAGIRVLALVSMSTAAISMASVAAITGIKNQPVDGVLRTVQGVLSEIGFLGAGVIMRAQGRDEVHGMTTAASVWVSAIIGIICGLGQWMLAVCAFILAYTILILGRWIEGQVLRLSPRLPTPSPVQADPETHSK